MEIVKQRLKEKFIPEKPDYADVFSCYDKGGFFTDVNYECQERVAWSPLVHVERMWTIAYGLNVDENCPFYGDKEAGEKLEKLLDFYLEKHPICTNWYHNDIKIPALFFPVYLYGEHLFTEERMEKFFTFFIDKVDGNSAGANQVWLSEVLIYKAIMTKDDALLKRAVGHIADEVYISEGINQGIKPDYAFAQHRLQVYNNGYGAPFLHNVSEWVRILLGTKFEFPLEKTELLIRLLVDGMLKMGRHKTKDFSTVGRGHVAPVLPDGEGMYGYKTATKNLLPYAKEEDKRIMNLFLDRVNGAPYTEEENFNRAYPSVAFMTHNRVGFYSSLRFCDKNMRGSEVINSENFIGGFQSFGCCTYMKTGQEYLNIYPVWDYGCIPGTTTPHTTLSPVLETQDTEFARVLSDGVYGFGASEIIKTYKNCEVEVTSTGYLSKYLDENAEDVHFGGRKATFFFDKQVVHLGNSLYCDHENDYHTTADQCYLNGSVTADGKVLERCDGLRDTGAKTVIHNDMVFKILDDNTFTVKNGKQIGSYQRIAEVPDYPKGEIEKDVFTILINHGKKPKSAGYEYIVFPNGECENAKVISNNEIQAVFCDNILCIVFFKGGTLEFDGKKITADRECLVMVKENEVLVDDKLAEVTVDVK